MTIAQVEYLAKQPHDTMVVLKATSTQETNSLSDRQCAAAVQ
jgi:hypothetical protein